MFVFFRLWNFIFYSILFYHVGLLGQSFNYRMTFFMRSLNYFLSLNRSKFYYIFYLIPKSFSRIVLSFIPLTNYLFDIFAHTISPSELGVLAPIFDIFSPHNIVHCHRCLAAIAAHLTYPRCRYCKIILFWPTAVRTSAILSGLALSPQH